MTPETPTTKSNQKKWLKRLKNESWEAELLVSAVAIFAIFKAFDGLHWLVNFFINYLPTEQYFIGYMISFFGYLAFGILGAFFVIHFGLRAYWIGLVGLNSVFPDYSVKDSAYSEIYTAKLTEKLPKITSTIDTLDEICSTIFSVAFTFLVMYMYMGVFSFIYLNLYNQLIDKVPQWALLTPIYLLAILYLVVALIMIIANLKRFKTNEKIQTWYFHAAMWGNKLMFGPLYKSILQVSMIMGSNFKKKKALVRTLLFMIVFGMALSVFQIFQSNVLMLLQVDRPVDKTRTYNEYYATQFEGELLLMPQIEAPVIKNDPVSLFVPVLDHETSRLTKVCGLNEIDYEEGHAGRLDRYQDNLNCYAKHISIWVDDRPVQVEFLKTDHPTTGQFGLTGFVNLQEISLGSHRLKIAKSVSSETQKSWEIPFYYTPN